MSRTSPMPDNDERTAARRGLMQIETWVFDLDNTLYPHHLNLWQQVDARIRAYIAEFLKSPRTRRSVCRKTITGATAPRCAD